MCDIKENSGNKKSSNGKFKINFNQDYTSLAVVNDSGYKLFSIQSVNKVEEIFCSDNVDTKIAERLFASSLVAVVITSEQNKLRICHFKKRADICDYRYPKNILAVKLNRSRLVVCLKDSIYVHNIRDMRLLHSIKNLPENPTGLCALSLNSHLAYPITKDIGNIQIFDAGNLQSRIVIEAHSSSIAAMGFSSTGSLLATASEKGTVIRVFCVKNAQRVVEFRRGVKRYAQIVSLNFSICNNFVSVSSNTETVHIFKVDQKAKEAAERRQEKVAADNSSDEMEKIDEPTGFMAAVSKAMNSIIPVGNVLCQDRAFAHVQLAESGLKYQCVVTKLEKETRLLVACEDGFLYIYNLDESGGECKLIRAHDLRGSLYDITELTCIESSESTTTSMSDSLAIKDNITLPIKTSYAEVMKGNVKDECIENEKSCGLKDTVEYSKTQMFDEIQFPPVCQA